MIADIFNKRKPDKSPSELQGAPTQLAPKPTNQIAPELKLSSI